MKLFRHHFSPVAASFAALSLSCAVARAQPAPPPPAPLAPVQPVPDTLDLKAAVAFALNNNFAIRQARERIRQQ